MMHNCVVKKFLLGILICCLSLFGGAVAAKTILQPKGYVNDFAGILKAEERTNLENLLSQTEKATTTEIAVVTIPTLEDENLEEYANELFNQWGIGKKGKDNGVLILVAKKEHKIRIEVGYGLEAVLPDGKCGQIIRDVLTPAFRKQEFGTGLYQAASLISQIIQGQEPVIPSPGKESSDKVPLGFALCWIGFCLFFTLMALGMIGLSIQLVSLAGLFFYTRVITSPHQSLLDTANSLLFMVVPFAITWLSGFTAGFFNKFHKNNLKRRYGNDWNNHWPWWYGLPPGITSNSGYSSGGFGGGFGSGGGFGGGSSGGGGASGGW